MYYFSTILPCLSVGLSVYDFVRIRVEICGIWFGFRLKKLFFRFRIVFRVTFKYNLVVLRVYSPTLGVLTLRHSNFFPLLLKILKWQHIIFTPENKILNLFQNALCFSYIYRVYMIFFIYKILFKVERFVRLLLLFSYSQNESYYKNKYSLKRSLCGAE